MFIKDNIEGSFKFKKNAPTILAKQKGKFYVTTKGKVVVYLGRSNNSNYYMIFSQLMMKESPNDKVWFIDGKIKVNEDYLGNVLKYCYGNALEKYFIVRFERSQYLSAFAMYDIKLDLESKIILRRYVDNYSSKEYLRDYRTLQNPNQVMLIRGMTYHDSVMDEDLVYCGFQLFESDFVRPQCVHLYYRTYGKRISNLYDSIMKDIENKNGRQFLADVNVDNLSYVDNYYSYVGIDNNLLLSAKTEEEEEEEK